MIKLPSFDKKFEYENNFYLSCDSTRISKFIAHYELYKRTVNLPGHFVETGVFKGASFTRFAAFRELLETNSSKKLIGFDTFDKFPDTEFEQDKGYREKFVGAAGDESITKDQLIQILERKGNNNGIELIEGDITHTVPQYVINNPELKISLLNLDVDIYEPAVIILDELYPKLVRGGILILDDYGVFPGETKAIDEYFKNKNVKIQKLPFSKTPSFIVKDEI
ncbi:dTDP-6-deoxy-L-hexose 3-O-methyltransferase [Gracilibacillus salitolerans]|uniref:dTDP-6-deoxy-L-hexose 3-O-methyltransferase n=2 Tax=Gracilibacillus salitolerans TaxID=2663022 RepID=A0A5Q2TS75_9BACI|nr:dTDP-6-deoxy-L-hexose 3-O-methyltransferase [Gracilibacillus salitolerans]